MKRFLDTNILVYAYDRDAGPKHQIAQQLVEEGWQNLGETAVSVQVLQELYVNLVRLGSPEREAAQIARDFKPWPVIENTFALLDAALAERQRWQLSFWDASILAAARASGAEALCSEDFSHGQDYRGVVATNPFRSAA